MTYECHCVKCGKDFLRPRRRGNFEVCSPCQRKARVTAWKLAHPERRLELNRQWASLNREKDRASKSAWQKRNRGAECAKTRRRQCAQAQRTPPWSDLDACKAFYVIAQRVSDCTGIPFEVDHEVPLRGRTVSGLHVPFNLVVMSRAENQRKGARHGY